MKSNKISNLFGYENSDGIFWGQNIIAKRREKAAICKVWILFISLNLIFYRELTDNQKSKWIILKYSQYPPLVQNITTTQLRIFFYESTGFFRFRWRKARNFFMCFCFSAKEVKRWPKKLIWAQMCDNTN